MKGIIFTILEEFVTANLGEEALFSILKESDLDTKEPFISPGTYPDSDLIKFAVTTCKKAGLPLEQGLKAFGEFAFAHLFNYQPTITQNLKSTKQLLLAVEGIIHHQVKKIHPEAKTPKFIYENVRDDSMEIVYHSDRKLCFVMEGLILGCANHFKEKISISQIKCQHTGHEDCRFKVIFA